MIEVVPLKYGAAFKRIFSQPEVFSRFVFTIVVLTSVPRDGSVNFSCAVSDFSPVDERGNRVSVYPHRLAVYPHRLVFLSPPLA